MDNIYEHFRKNPASTLEQPKVPQRLPKVISLKEIEEIFQTNLKPLELVIMELLYSCGLRVSELVNLKINDVDLASKYIRCFGKGSKRENCSFWFKGIGSS